ncbi:MAG: hypothetical protein AB4041_05305 [Microcystaceae cyanobacterium]
MAITPDDVWKFLAELVEEKKKLIVKCKKRFICVSTNRGNRCAALLHDDQFQPRAW